MYYRQPERILLLVCGIDDGRMGEGMRGYYYYYILLKLKK
jgi:hypothetical protein